jgi:hypothetical protein
MSSSLASPVFLEQRVALSPSEFTAASADMDGFLIKKIAATLNGQCCMHGYVVPGSTQLLARSMGEAEHGKFTGDFLYICKLRIQNIAFTADQIIKAKVISVNKSGVIAIVLDNGVPIEAAQIFCPRDYHLGSTTFDALTKDNEITVRVLKTKFQVNDPYIKVLGAVV